MNDQKRMSVITKIDKAIEHVHGLCDGKFKWRMSIPVNFTDDSDIIICGALCDAKKHIEADERKRCATCKHWQVSVDWQEDKVRECVLLREYYGPLFGCVHYEVRES